MVGEGIDVGMGKIALGTERGWVGFETDGMAHVYMYVINFFIILRTLQKARKEIQLI